MKRIEVEHEEAWHKWMEEIPSIQFPSHWNIRIIPPFGGAMARFLVFTNKDECVSVYLDVFGSLGYFPNGPYWEIYPIKGDNVRVPMHDVKKLLNHIEKALDEQRTESLDRRAKNYK